MSTSTPPDAVVAIQSSTLTAAGNLTVNATVNNAHGAEPLISVSKWLSKLASINQYAIQDETFEKVSPGTCAWILEKKEFEKWISGSSGTFWGIGIPGAGKTILTSFVVHHLKGRAAAPGPNGTVLFFYCRYNNEPKIKQILASLLLQLVDHSPPVDKFVEETLYITCTKQETEPTQTALESTLRDAIRLVPKVFIMIDALDELHDHIREELVRILISLKHPLFLTSRELTLGSLSAPNIHVRAPDTDFRRFITQEIDRLPKLSSLLKDRDEVLSEVVDGVLKKSDGMFLLSALQVAALGSVTTISSLRKSTKNLPTTLSGMYRLTLQRITNQSPEESSLALRAILWVAHAFEPLTSTMLLTALAVDLDSTEFDPDAVAEGSTLLSVCCGLLSIDEKGGVRLIHYTTHDYFRDNSIPHKPFDDPHTFAATICAIYQQLYVTGSKRSGRTSSIHPTTVFPPEVQSDSYPFLAYAVLNLGHHTCQSTLRHKGLVPTCLGRVLFDEQSRILLALSDWKYADSGGFPHFAALCGHLEWVEDYPQTVNQLSDHLHVTPFMYACLGRHTSIAQLLLETGRVDIDATDKDGLTALDTASGRGDTEIVELLLESGASVKAGSGALLQALTKLHPEVASLLLNHGATQRQCDIAEDANAFLNNGALHKAAARGYTHIVERMLGFHTININAMILGKTPLISAFEAHDQDPYNCSRVIHLFLDLPGIDYNAHGGKNNKTALHLAARAGLFGAINKLLKFSDLEINARDKSGRTALHRAIWSPECLTLLIRSGKMDIIEKDYSGWTPLHYAAFYGQYDCVQILLKDDLPRHIGIINEKIRGNLLSPYFNSTAVDLAMCKSHIKVAKLLQNVDTSQATQEGEE